MRFKSTLLMLLVFVALGGYVYFAEYRGQEERQKQEAAKKKVFPIEAKDISEITLEYPERKISAVRKGEKQWDMTDPPGMEADSDEWESVASNLARVDREETAVTAEKTDVAQYGLDKPAVRIAAKLQGDGRSLDLLIGDNNPGKTFNYAKLADKDEIFLVGPSWSGLFKKSLTDLRNKKVLDFEAENVDGVRIEASGAPEIAVQRSPDVKPDWSLKKPLEARADGAAVSSFLSAIQFAHASDFAAVDLKTAGLESPAAKVTLHDQKAGADRVLLFGKSPETDKYFAKDQSRPAIFIVGKEIFEQLRRPVLDWRDKSITQFNREEIDEVEIARGSERTSVKKTGSDWQLADGRKIQQDKISGMLSSLELERASEIVDSPKPFPTYGLEKARLEVTLRKSGKEVVALKFGAENKKAGIYAKASSSPAVLTVSRTLYEDFDVKLNDLVDSQPAAEPTAK